MRRGQGSEDRERRAKKKGYESHAHFQQGQRLLSGQTKTTTAVHALKATADRIEANMATKEEQATQTKMLQDIHRVLVQGKLTDEVANMSHVQIMGQVRSIKGGLTSVKERVAEKRQAERDERQVINTARIAQAQQDPSAILENVRPNRAVPKRAVPKRVVTNNVTNSSSSGNCNHLFVRGRNRGMRCTRNAGHSGAHGVAGAVEPVQSTEVAVQPVQSTEVAVEPVQSTEAAVEPFQSTEVAVATSEVSAGNTEASWDHQ